MTDAFRLLAPAILGGLAVALSYVFALAGHPSAAWWWCSMGRAC